MAFYSLICNFAKNLKMKKIFLLFLSAVCLTSCFESMEDRAAREAQEYTERNCPTPAFDNTITDSLTFDKTTHTFGHYQRLIGPNDIDASIFESKRPQIHQGLVKEVKGNLNYKIYIEEGYHFAFISRSGKTGDVLYVDTVKNQECK